MTVQSSIPPLFAFVPHFHPAAYLIIIPTDYQTPTFGGRRRGKAAWDRRCLLIPPHSLPRSSPRHREAPPSGPARRRQWRTSGPSPCCPMARAFPAAQSRGGAVSTPPLPRYFQLYFDFFWPFRRIGGAKACRVHGKMVGHVMCVASRMPIVPIVSRVGWLVPESLKTRYEFQLAARFSTPEVRSCPGGGTLAPGGRSGRPGLRHGGGRRAL